MSSDNCAFCDILNGKNETKLEAETDEFVIFKDIKPATEHHYLIIPKQHYESLKVLDQSHEKIVVQMEEELKKFFVSKNINTTDALFGFHLPPLIAVKHLHMHGISPRSAMGFIARLIFRPSSAWFKSGKEALTYLSRKGN